MGCRHVFEERRYAEEYRASDVERELGLDQAKLIRFAMLLGSDYTEGVSGVGEQHICPTSHPILLPENVWTSPNNIMQQVQLQMRCT